LLISLPAGHLATWKTAPGDRLENSLTWFTHTGKKADIRRKSDRQKTRHQRAGEWKMLESAKWAQWAGTLEIPLANTAQSSEGKFLPFFWSYEEGETQLRAYEMSVLMHWGRVIIPQASTCIQLEQISIL